MANELLTTEPLVLPPVVSEAEWRRAHDALLAKEKAATRARDALAAERRRQPMVRIEKSYIFESTKGKVSLLDLFEGRRQLIVYHFMFGPGARGWPDAGCPGCSMFVDQIGHLAHLHASRSFARPRVDRAAGEDRGLSKAHGLEHVLGVVGGEQLQPRLRHDDGPRREARTERVPARWRRARLSHLLHDRARRRGVGQRLDLPRPRLRSAARKHGTDSPEGWPQTTPYAWWRRHDEYAPPVADGGADCLMRKAQSRGHQSWSGSPNGIR